MTFKRRFNDESQNDGDMTHPVITVTTQRSGPQDSWLVIGAATTGLRILQPTAHADVRPSFVLDSVYAALANGSGVFTTGRRTGEIDSGS